MVARILGLHACMDETISAKGKHTWPVNGKGLTRNLFLCVLSNVRKIAPTQ